MNNGNGLRTIRQQVADRIRAQVLAGEYLAGHPLREIELAQQFGVSRGPVRDALLQLSQEGLLTYQPNSGVRVGVPPSDVTRDLAVNLRRQIEIATIRGAFDAIPADARRRWDKGLARLRLACEAGDTGEVVEADVAFHEAILSSCQAFELLPVWKMLCANMRFSYKRLTDYIEVYNEHVAIIEAFDRRDLDGMISALEANIR